MKERLEALSNRVDDRLGQGSGWLEAPASQKRRGDLDGSNYHTQEQKYYYKY